LGFPFNISATTEDSDLKFNMLLGFTKAHHKITPRKKVGMALGQGSSHKFGVFRLIFMQWLKVSITILVHSSGGQFGPS